MESNHDNKHNSGCQSQIHSIAQDGVYTASGDRYLTPKHIGMGSTLRQAMRSKELVNLFHKAGHFMSYQDFLRFDTDLAENTLRTMDETGAIVPLNLVRVAFCLFLHR